MWVCGFSFGFEGKSGLETCHVQGLGLRVEGSVLSVSGFGVGGWGFEKAHDLSRSRSSTASKVVNVLFVASPGVGSRVEGWGKVLFMANFAECRVEG